ncbi:MAG: hypothetical protein R3C16_12125 [Hyphomonadaceae bacterium]
MRVLIVALLAATAACAAAPVDTAPVCTAERAIYTLRDQPDARLRFVATPHRLNATTDLALRVEFEGDSYWFALTSSQGFSRNYVGQTIDPFEAARREDAGEESDGDAPEYNGSELVLFNAVYGVEQDVPQSGDPAPAHLLANGIASAIWYSEPRRHLPLGMWDLSDCADDDLQP